MISKNIRSVIPVIQKFMSEQPILRAWLFGSCSRGEETPDSDIDILVDYDNSEGRVSLFKMGGILMDLSDLLGRKVDLVENRGVLNFARDSIDRDKILIYERLS
ncbi:MAG: nucleotidyltransferase domain-containing protein [Duncaniella sp.]|nr:nucleotidyltransferase domain-containing protein [Duncaniella sp.]